MYTFVMHFSLVLLYDGPRLNTYFIYSSYNPIQNTLPNKNECSMAFCVTFIPYGSYEEKPDKQLFLMDYTIYCREQQQGVLKYIFCLLPCPTLC